MDDGLTVARAIDWLQNARGAGKKNGLDNMRALLALLGNPEKRLRCVHVAGTNGKGSTCAYIERALRENGLRTGLYTSPYLCRYQERVRADGIPISDRSLLRNTRRLQTAVETLNGQGIHPTAFELVTALAFQYFAEAKVDVAVIEVGLGGRLDSTNVIDGEIAAIAPVALDHMHILGDTVAAIAQEKAGIIKPGAPAVIGRQAEEAMAELVRIADQRGAPLYRLDELPLTVLSQTAYGARFTVELPEFGRVEQRVTLPGRHQIDNAALALLVLAILKSKGWPLHKDDVVRGVTLAEWPGRLEWIDEGLLIDGAHNPQGAEALAEYLRTYCGSRRIVLLSGMMREKQHQRCAEILAPLCVHAVTTKVDWPRALDPEVLADEYRAHGAPATAVRSVPEALAAAKALAGDGLVVCCGSLYLAGDVRTLVKPGAGSLGQ